jgi:hypothetical protein
MCWGAKCERYPIMYGTWCRGWRRALDPTTPLDCACGATPNDHVAFNDLNTNNTALRGDDVGGGIGGNYAAINEWIVTARE